MSRKAARDAQRVKHHAARARERALLSALVTLAVTMETGERAPISAARARYFPSLITKPVIIYFRFQLLTRTSFFLFFFLLK